MSVTGLEYLHDGTSLVHKGRPSLTPGSGGGFTDSFILGTTEPDASNTGVGVAGRPARTTLPIYNGDYVVSANNEVLNNTYVKGRLIVGAHSGFRASNCVFEPPASVTYSGESYIANTQDATDAYLEFCELTYAGNFGGMNGIGRKNFYIYRCDLSHGADLVRINMGGNGAAPATGGYFARVEGCYLHDQLLRTPDPVQTRTDYKTHSDGIQLEGNSAGSLTRIFGNSINAFHSTDGSSNVTYAVRITTSGGALEWVPSDSAGNTTNYGNGGTPTLHIQSLSAVMITPNGGATVTNVQLESNWLRGGELTVNGPDNAGGTSVMKNNLFGTDQIANSANNRWYPRSYTGGMVVSGNTLMDGTTPA